MEKVKKMKKIIFVSLIISAISFIITVNTPADQLIWYLSRMIFFISIIIYCISMLYVTIIAKKNNLKLSGWLGTMQFISLVIIILIIIMLIINFIFGKYMDRELENTMRQGREILQNSSYKYQD